MMTRINEGRIFSQEATGFLVKRSQGTTAKGVHPSCLVQLCCGGMGPGRWIDETLRGRRLQSLTD